jgi:hypothetical protein
MSTFKNPVGPQPSNVYWRRRLAVLAGVVVVIVIIILIVARPGSGKPSAANTHTPAGTSHTAVTTAPACKPADVQVIAITDANSYAAGIDPMLSLSITNTGSTACSFKDGTDVQAYTITSGSDVIWKSTDCQTDAVAATSVLKPGTPVSSTPFAWNRTRSNPAACSATNAPTVVAGGASYHLTVAVNGITSTAANSPQFILK